jgi:integrase
MVIGGIDLVTVKEILGHATIQMTMRYAHPTSANKRHAVEVLSRLFEPPNAEAGQATQQPEVAS